MVANPFQLAFEDPQRASSYATGPFKFTPGFADLHRMVDVLLGERAPPGARILVHGAGGGLELKALADQHEDWIFTGVDPAKPMLDQARDRLGTAIERVELIHGLVDDVEGRGYDGATSLLTLHFLDAEERLRTVTEIVRRLKPGAPLVVVHCSFSQEDSQRRLWLSRYAQYAMASGVPEEQALAARDTVAASMPVLDPEQDAEILRAAGLAEVVSFYSAFAWHGWIGYAA